MIILAHRANSTGINRKTENTQEAIAACFRRGWGIETDIRRAADGKSYYISHDPAEPTVTNSALEILQLIREFKPPLVAMNIKELGYERELVDFLREQGVLGRMFLFDMELLEAEAGQTAALFRSLDAEVKLAARCSDRGETVERAAACPHTSVVWADEFDSLWLRHEDFERIKAAGKSIYAISPEIHGFSPEDRRRRWADFLAWGIDGICTDYPEELNAFLKQNQSRIQKERGDA